MSDPLKDLEKRRHIPTGSPPLQLVCYKGVWLTSAGPQNAEEKKIYAEAHRLIGPEHLPKFHDPIKPPTAG